MIGIIAEYNPFHNGHLYHLQQAKKENKTIVLVLAGHFLNRGEVSIINKWDKTKLALDYGVDLVVELPFIFASQASDIYTYGAISILNHLKCEKIIFGSESNNIEFSDVNDIKKYLKKGYNYPKAMSLANEIPTTPNDILGMGYIKAIKKLNSNIIPQTIKRTNDYHDINLNTKITSATSIRNAINENKDIKKYVPNTKYIQNVNIEELFIILKHKITLEDLSKYPIDKNLAGLLKKHINTSKTIEQLINKVKHKNNTYNKIKRSLIHILTNFTNEDNIREVKYIRILGLNKKGMNYLNKIKKEIKIPIYSKYNENLKLEYNATFIYSLLTKDDILEKEFKKIIIKC